MNRRTFISSIVSTTTIFATAGCVTVEPGGTVDVVVNNCLDSDQTDGKKDKKADIQIRHERNNMVIFDETVTVPEMSCSDVVDGVEHEDVFPEAGLYTVSVTVDGYDQSEEQVEFSNQEIEDNTDNVVITIRENNIRIA